MYHCDNDQPKGYGDQEHAPPGKLMRQQPSQKWAKGEAHVHRGDIDPYGLAPFVRWEHRGEDRDASGKDHGAPDPLENATYDEHQTGSGDSRQKGGDREQGNSMGEDPLPPVDIGEPSKGNQRHRCG